MNKVNTVLPHYGRLFSDKRDEALTHIARQANLRDTLSRRSQTEKATCRMSPLIGNVQSRRVHRNRKRTVVARGWKKGVGVTANTSGVFLLG